MERRDPFTRWWRRSPYSLSKIWLAATEEDADKFRSRFVDPSFGEPRPERMTVDQWARSCSKPRELLCFGEPVRLDESSVQRGNGSGGPSTPKPDITPAGQQPTRRVYHFNPATIAECGGPCEEGGAAACDCGAVTWTNQPVKPEFPLPRKIKEDWQ
jgi:hypothetical protein